MSRMDLSDVEHIVKLLAEAGDPTVELSLAERKRTLLNGIARLTDTDVWMWSTSRYNPAVPGDVASLNLIDGGWADEAEKVRMIQFLTDPDTSHPTQAALLKKLEPGEHQTVDIQQFLPADVWEQAREKYYAVGMSHCLLSLYPISEIVSSNVGFHRRTGRPPYSDRERAIIHVVLQQVDWLHRHATDIPARDDIVQLSPRERQVLLYLLAGETRRTIAKKLELSEHTVGDYMKGIYQRLKVNTRGALMAKFISGGGDKLGAK